MSNRTFIIVLTIILLIIMCPILIVCFWDVDNETDKGKINSMSDNKEIPTLELKLSTEEPEQEKVTIFAVAKTSDSEGILNIKLPDSSIKEGDTASYIVTENGDYHFEVESKNGQKNSADIKVNNIKSSPVSTPYMPNGFSHLEGDSKSGYVIQDSYKNEYVWVPVEKNSLIRKMEQDTSYSDNEQNVNKFVESVNKYGGFYIARYEASISKNKDSSKYVATTIQNRAPWTNVSYSTAQDVAMKTSAELEYGDCKTEIMNSYAWDTTLKWIDSSIVGYSEDLNYGNYSGNITYTGATKTDMVNNICDISGNVKEWTSEKYIGNSNSSNECRVVRGGNMSSNKSASNYEVYESSKVESGLGFRLILYKSV
ncbi:MAG: formylglycine-generating enzyme family protein [Clostridia bacterium]|nr:formylglycine-generating enzyme family protein [Clostridia bacterium]